MGIVIVYIAMSLDGYIADAGGSVAWLGGDGSDPGNPGSYPEFIETVDAVVLGHSTYHQIVTELSPDTWPYAGKQTYVLTHGEHANQPEITFTSQGVAELLPTLRDGLSGNVWICGGASVVNQALRARLVDEFIVSIIPTLLGGGIPLFDKKDFEQRLSLVSTRSYDGIAELTHQMRSQ